MPPKSRTSHKVANASSTEFQKLVAGARTVGIKNDKLSDILKDVNYKLGNFLVTGGGELKEFFKSVEAFHVARSLGQCFDHLAFLRAPSPQPDAHIDQENGKVVPCAQI